MKTRFKYKFTPLFIVCFAAGLILGVAAIILNAIRLSGLIKAGDSVAYHYISAIISILTGILAFVFILPAVISSEYVIKDGELISVWGLIKSRMKISDITQITHFRKTDKLVVYFSDESYLNICIRKEDFEDFIDSLKSVNKKIFYSLETDVDANN